MGKGLWKQILAGAPGVLMLLCLPALAIAWYGPWAWRALEADAPRARAVAADASQPVVVADDWQETAGSTPQSRLATQDIQLEKRELSLEIAKFKTLLNRAQSAEVRASILDLIGAKTVALNSINLYLRNITGHRQLSSVDVARVTSLNLSRQITALRHDSKRFPVNSPGWLLLNQQLNLLLGESSAFNSDYRDLTRLRANQIKILDFFNTLNVQIARADRGAFQAQQQEITSNNISLAPTASPFVFRGGRRQ